MEPQKVWLKCGAMGGNANAVEAEMYCIDEIYVRQLRTYIIEMSALLQKYENATKVMNND